MSTIELGAIDSILEMPEQYKNEVKLGVSHRKMTLQRIQEKIKDLMLFTGANHVNMPILGTLLRNDGQQ